MAAVCLSPKIIFHFLSLYLSLSCMHMQKEKNCEVSGGFLLHFWK